MLLREEIKRWLKPADGLGHLLFREKAMLIELYEGFFVNPELVAVVKGMGGEKCALFTVGQSAVDEGFAIPYSAEEVSKHLNDAEQEMYEEGEESEDDD